MAAKLGPSIINNGLVLDLDAADINSYIGSGTSWKDMTGNGNSGTLVNGPSFSGSNGGSIVFDGIDDYVILNGGNNLNNWNADGINSATSYRSYTSANIWFKAATTSTSGVQKMIFSDNFGVEYGFSQTNNTLYATTVAVNSTTISANTWYNACIVGDAGRPTSGTYSQTGTTTITCTTTYPITFTTGAIISIEFAKSSGPDAVPANTSYVVTVTGANTFTITSSVSATSNGSMIYSSSTNQSSSTFYLNGVLISSATGNTRNGANDAPFNLGRDNGSATSYWSGNIATLQLYNKNLTATEILQNYNATKSRFGL
jgi:hypothetical protein